MKASARKFKNRPPAFRFDEPSYDDAIMALQARCLASQARKFARGLDVLFHGTRYRERILASGFLKFSPFGSIAVSFTRSPEVAAYWATLPRDVDEGAGPILIFDRPALKAKYKLECVDERWYGDPSEHDEFWRAKHDEYEERVQAKYLEIAPHLIGMICTPLGVLSRKGRAIRRASELSLAAETAKCICGSRWRTCSDCAAGRTEKMAEQLEATYPGISSIWKQENDQ